ncbi:fumarate hydratase [Chloroflexota bacterium]
MRNIEVKQVAESISRLCQEANIFLPPDVLVALRLARQTEDSPMGRQALDKILGNARLAQEEGVAICQDCGVAVVYLEIGQDAHITGGDLYQAVNEGVRQGYGKGYLRKSMVNKPFSSRINTKDNTPAVIHTDIVPGTRLKITVVPKGGGSENGSRLFMLTPAQGRQGIIDSVVRSVDQAGANPCPPIIVGVGIGGTVEKSFDLAKRALLRKVDKPNLDGEVAELEREILRKVNNLGIGPMGYGGRLTALAVHIETFPVHIASLPVAVNIQCHAARHKQTIL